MDAAAFTDCFSDDDKAPLARGFLFPPNDRWPSVTSKNDDGASSGDANGGGGDASPNSDDGASVGDASPNDGGASHDDGHDPSALPQA